ncbi:helix-turn-helix domain-containing protein [Streptomyces sp. NRRL F-5123]|uniref:AraC-like ligand-binding domain-containing protein n=1 Tax=Streptomyces sp. NRRL F-5123 TaxID=1463856 RepID=UPI0004E23889|nr:helix-turn-helix domain-containing protein [Streptomyces sp. NRRL F-5123]
MFDVVLDSADLPAADRFEWWLDVTASTLTPTVLTCDDTDDFRAGIRALRLGDVQVASVTYSSLRSRRTPALVRRADAETYYLAVTLKGAQSISQVRRDATLEAGELLLYDSSHPFDAHAHRGAAGDGVEAIIVSVARTVLPLPAARAERLLAVPLPGGAGMGRLLREFLTGVVSEPACSGEQDALRLGTAAVDLVTACLAHYADAADAVPPESRTHALTAGIHAFIEHNLGDRQLSPTAVAAAHHISLRYLHLLFQRQGTSVAAWIKQRRLDRCRRDLGDPSLAHVPIAAIASRWGLTLPAEFSRAFRAAYGMTPSDYRYAARR